MAWWMFLAIGMVAGLILAVCLSFIFCPIGALLEIDRSHPEKDYFRFTFLIEPEYVVNNRLIFVKVKKADYLKLQQENANGKD